jgi:hypothetical protein
VQYNKRDFFKDIFVFVLLSHVVLLAIVFLCDSGKFTPERFVMHDHKNQSTIVFMPLAKRIKQHTSSHDAHQIKSMDRKVIDYDMYQKKLAQKVTEQVKKEQPAKVVPVQFVEQKIKPAIEKKHAPSPVKKAATVVQSKPVIQKKVEKNIPAQHTQKKDTKLVVDKKKDTTQLKPDIKKDLKQEKPLEQKPVLPELKKHEHKQVEVIDKEVKKVVTSDPAAEQKEKQSPEQQNPVVQDKQNLDLPLADDDGSLDHVTFVGSHDLEMLEIQDHIKMQVREYYKPPVGMSKHAICELLVFVGNHGRPERVSVKKSSGSRANDMCARAALFKITLPKKLYGKEIIVELGQA